jgi:hypothetical protein
MHETIAGPLAVDGHTIALVSRTRVVDVGRGPWRARVVGSRPTHVEVLAADGARHVVRIHDLERRLLAALALGAVAFGAWRVLRR